MTINLRIEVKPCHPRSTATVLCRDAIVSSAGAVTYDVAVARAVLQLGIDLREGRVTVADLASEPETPQQRHDDIMGQLNAMLSSVPPGWQMGEGQ
jgi:hypothetical protein